MSFKYVVAIIWQKFAVPLQAKLRSVERTVDAMAADIARLMRE